MATKQTKTGQTSKGRKQDGQQKAMKAGKRISASGNAYTETRDNRSDKKPTAKKGKKL